MTSFPKSAIYKRLFIVIGVSVVLGLYWYFNPIGMLFPKCPVYHFTGLYCTGCGSQRALHAFLNGHFADALRQNLLATFCFIAFIAELLFGLLQITAWRPSVLLRQKRYAALAILLLLVIFTICRNFPVYPFTLLAPFT